MPVITMTGSLGSGAREVGQAVAARLGVDFVDQQLMVEAAQRCGVPVGAVAAHDERRAGFRERISSVLNTFLERSAASGADPLTGNTGLEAILSRSYADLTEDETPHVSDDLFLETTSAIIRELSASGAIVILGRGGQMVLADQPRALHVLCVAPRDLRAQRLAEREEIGMEEATRRVTEGDRARDAFYRKFWKVDVRDPRLYDIAVNTERVPYEMATEIVAQAATLKAGETPASS